MFSELPSHRDRDDFQAGWDLGWLCVSMKVTRLHGQFIDLAGHVGRIHQRQRQTIGSHNIAVGNLEIGIGRGYL